MICRCGALTLSEIAACAKPSLLIPFPQATHNHQESNARVVERAGAGIVLLQPALTGVRLAERLRGCWTTRIVFETWRHKVCGCETPVRPRP